jgi:hypothetical protein
MQPPALGQRRAVCDARAGGRAAPRCRRAAAPCVCHPASPERPPGGGAPLLLLARLLPLALPLPLPLLLTLLGLRLCVGLVVVPTAQLL